MAASTFKHSRRAGVVIFDATGFEVEELFHYFFSPSLGEEAKWVLIVGFTQVRGRLGVRQVHCVPAKLTRGLNQSRHPLWMKCNGRGFIIRRA